MLKNESDLARTAQLAGGPQHGDAEAILEGFAKVTATKLDRAAIIRRPEMAYEGLLSRRDLRRAGVLPRRPPAHLRELPRE